MNTDTQPLSPGHRAPTNTDTQPSTPDPTEPAMTAIGVADTVAVGRIDLVHVLRGMDFALASGAFNRASWNEIGALAAAVISAQSALGIPSSAVP